DSLSMILITVPVFLPLAETIGFDKVWFGIFVVVVAEMGLITPPVGMNIFVIRAQMPDIALGAVYRGIVPFLFADAALVVLLVLIPSLALWLPKVFYG
ncbi:MAG: TRAP transporter large permease subunit, partial [Bauldia litoralis]